MDLGKSICHKPAFNLFEDIVLKIELPERSDACVWLTCRRSIVTLVTLSSLLLLLSPFQSERTDAERPGKCHAARSVLYTHREYPGKAWKFDIGSVFLYCNYSIFFEAELSP